MSDPVRSIENLIADVDRLRSLALEAESRHAELIARVRDRHRHRFVHLASGYANPERTGVPESGRHDAALSGERQ